MSLPSVLMLGTGEYTTGYGGGKGSDKTVGVVGLIFFYLRSQKKVGRLLMAGSNGTKFPAIREHIAKNIKERYSDLSDVSFESYPADDVARDPVAYIKAMDTMKKGDLVTIFTPDDTHYEMAKEALKRGFHVLVTKPAVKKLKEHKELVELAKANNSLITIEVHKRWDGAYADARFQCQNFGDFSYFYSYMAQPKYQLNTFKGWKWGPDASSDISYYLNSHHVDFLCWVIGNRARPTQVIGTVCTGVAKGEPYGLDTQDTITLTVIWENIATKNKGTSVHTASWISPSSDVHTQQRCHYMGHSGEIMVDQAHRGYTVASDVNGFRSFNPFYMRYSTDPKGRFAGQHGYGALSIFAFVDASLEINAGTITAAETDKDGQLATMGTTETLTAILEAGKISMDNNSKTVLIKYENDASVTPSDLVLVA